MNIIASSNSASGNGCGDTANNGGVTSARYHCFNCSGSGTVGAAIVLPFDPEQAACFQKGQLLEHDGTVYAVNKDNPSGTPGTSPDFTPVSSNGTTGAAGTNSDVVDYDPSPSGGYDLGQLVEYNGKVYIVNSDNPGGMPGDSAGYMLLSSAGATGATGLSAAVMYNSMETGSYKKGELTVFNNGVYIVNTDNPSGFPGQSADYTLISGSGPTGATGPSTVTLYDPSKNSGYKKGELVSVGGILYIVNTDTPTGTAGSSPGYTRVLSTGVTGATGTCCFDGPTGTAEITEFNPAQSPGYKKGQLVDNGGTLYLVNTDSPAGTPGASPDYTSLTIKGPTGAAGLSSATIYNPAQTSAYKKGQLVDAGWGALYR